MEVPSGRIFTYASIIYRKMQTVSPVWHVWGSFKFRHSGNIPRKAMCPCCGYLGDIWRSRALFRIAVSWNAAQYLLTYQ